MEKILLITIVGPESSGKTTLSQQLAETFGCPWIPEFAREYLETLGVDYTFQDLEQMAKGQWDLLQQVLQGKETMQFRQNEIKAALPYGQAQNMQAGAATVSDFVDELCRQYDLPTSRLIVADSGMLTMQIWADIRFGKEISFVENALKEDITSLYLLTRPTDVWEPDPLREAPGLVDRAWIFNKYLKALEKGGMVYQTCSIV